MSKETMLDIDMLIADLISASFECGVNFNTEHYPKFLKKNMDIHKELTDKIERILGEPNDNTI